MPSLRVQPDAGPVVDLTTGGSVIRWTAPGAEGGDGAIDVLPLVIGRLRAENRRTPARALSLAVTHCEEALHWLQEHERTTLR